jgi:hypothetical protein
MSNSPISTEQIIFLIKELQIQKALKTRKVQELTKDVLVLSTTIELLTTDKVKEHPLYFFRHEHTQLPETSTTRVPRSVVPLAGDDITVITDIPECNIIAYALQNHVSDHALGAIPRAANYNAHEEGEYINDLDA